MTVKAFVAPRIGELRERLAIQRQVASQTAAKETTFTWTTVATVWARMQQATLGQRDGVVGVDELSRYVVTIRHRSDVTAGMRATWDGTTYELRSAVDPDGCDRWLLIDMQATAQDGT